jgi:hypothetical protein
MHDVVQNGKALMGYGAAGSQDRENSGLARQIQLLNGHISPGGLCRPSDNRAAILAALGM